jgi:hypothetical protein
LLDHRRARPEQSAFAAEVIRHSMLPCLQAIRSLGESLAPADHSCNRINKRWRECVLTK